MGTGEAPAAAAPGNPPALRPAAAAPARPRRQEQEEAPRGRRGHPEGRRGGGRTAGTARSPGAGGRGTRAGGGERGRCPCPRGLGRRTLRSGRALGPRGGQRQDGAADCPSGARASPRSHTLTLTHSPARSLSHPLRQKGSAAQQPVPPQRAEGGDSRNTAALSQKRREASGCSAHPAARAAPAGRPPPPGPAPRGLRGRSAVATAQSCRHTHHVGRPGGGRGPRLQRPECTRRRRGRPSCGSAPRGGVVGALHDGIRSPRGGESFQSLGLFLQRCR